MTNNPFSQHLLDLIEEDDRLIGLTEAIEINLVEDPVNNQWVLSTAPRKDYPLPIKPETRYGVDIEDLDDTIRSIWGEVAQLAKDTNSDDLQALYLDLVPGIPRSGEIQPAFNEWIPTNKPFRFESVRSVLTWTIDRFTIKPQAQFLTLALDNDGYVILDPHGKPLNNSHSLSTQEPEPNREAEYSISFNPYNEESVEEAYECARKLGLKRLSSEQYEQFTKLKKKAQRNAFLNGISLFPSVLAFFFGIIASHTIIPFLGPFIYLVILAYYYDLT